MLYKSLLRFVIRDHCVTRLKNYVRFDTVDRSIPCRPLQEAPIRQPPLPESRFMSS